MWALTTSSDEIRPDLIAFAIQVAEAPMTLILRRRLFATSDRVARLDVENLDSRADQLLDRRVQLHSRFSLFRTRGGSDLQTEKAILP